MYTSLNFPKQRKHTLAFLATTAKHQSIYLHAEIIADNLLSNKNSNSANGYLAYLIFVIAEVLKKYPRANSYVRSGMLSKIICYDTVSAKFTLDKNFDDERIVVSSVIHNVENLDIAQIQDQINYHKQANINQEGNFKEIKKMHVLPLWLGKFILKKLLKRPKKALKIQGTFSISSLGIKNIMAFFPTTSTTLGFGVGKLQERLVKDKDIIKATAIMPLTMVFDHRVIDGALAAEILDVIKHKIETLKTNEVTHVHN